MKYISEYEINWRANNLNESGVIDENIYINNHGEQYIIREKTHPVMPREQLDNLTYGIDYKIKDGFIILRDGRNYTMPRC